MILSYVRMESMHMTRARCRLFRHCMLHHAVSRCVIPRRARVCSPSYTTGFIHGLAIQIGVCIYIYIYTYIHIHIHIHTYISTYTYIHAYMWESNVPWTNRTPMGIFNRPNSYHHVHNRLTLSIFHMYLEKACLEKTCTNGQVHLHSQHKSTCGSCQGYLLVGAWAHQCMLVSIWWLTVELVLFDISNSTKPYPPVFQTHTNELRPVTCFCWTTKYARSSY